MVNEETEMNNRLVFFPFNLFPRLLWLGCLQRTLQ